MEKRTFGRTGLAVSVLGFGGAPVGILGIEQERVGRILNLLLDAGVNLIDTGASYSGSEEAIGATVSHRREQYILISKCGGRLEGIDAPAWSDELITQAIDRSLQRLRTDHLDAVLLHSCGLETLQKGALAALVKARDSGKIRFAGYSGDNEAAAYAAALPDIAIVQTSINICDQINIDLVLPLARQNNVGIMAKRPLANAAWKDLSEQVGFYQGYARTYTERLAQMKIDPAELGVAGEPRQAWPELALRFTLSQPGVHVAIIGTTSPENARANLAAAAKGPLLQPAVQRLRELFQAADPTRTWRGLT